MSEPTSIELAALAWCGEETSSIEMDTRLGKAFARILDEETSRLRTALATAEKERDQAKRVAKLACDDWAYETVETEKLLAPIIGQEFIDGDSFGVPTLADTVEEAIRQLQSRAMTPAVEALVEACLEARKPQGGPMAALDAYKKVEVIADQIAAERTGSDAGEKI